MGEQTTREMATIVDAEVMPAWMREDLEALKATVGRDLTDAQFKVFIAAARHLGLDPFARQVVPIKQGAGVTPQTTIDGFRLIAERTRKYAGQLGPYWCGPDGEWREVWLDEKHPPAAAKVGVLRRDFDQPLWAVARFASYNKGGNWNAMPDVMIAKVAESLALRKAFPNELSGAYTEEELGPALQAAPAGNARTLVVEERAGTADEQHQVVTQWPLERINELYRRAKKVGVANAGHWVAELQRVHGHEAPYSDGEYDDMAEHIAWLESEAAKALAAAKARTAAAAAAPSDVPESPRELPVPTAGARH